MTALVHSLPELPDDLDACTAAGIAGLSADGCPYAGNPQCHCDNESETP